MDRIALTGRRAGSYALSDGYKGPTDCQLLYSAKTDNTDIVSMNGLRTEPWFPPQFQRMVLVGDDGCGNLIGFDWNTCQAVLWNPADGDQVQLTRPTVTEIWNYVVD